jgi:hypothetical protein
MAAGAARAQTPPPAPPAAPSAPAPPPDMAAPPPAPMPAPAAPSTGMINPPPPSPEAGPPPATPSAIEASPKPPTSTESMPATRPDALPPIDVGAWLRASSLFQGATDHSKINDWSMNNAYAELHMGGKVHKKVGVTLDINANYGTGSNFAATIEDAFISFDFVDELHLWAGHLLVPVDRANSSGPFFMIPWNYPGNFAGSPFQESPHEGAFGRNNGAVVWGDIAGGRLTYLAGVFDNDDATSSPLVSGRVRLALWDPEPGFWGNASYFGDKDLLSIGVGAQYQDHGSAVRSTTGNITTDKNWADINADVLMEKKLGGGSFVTLEGAYYHFNVLDGAVNNAYYVLAAYATPTLGVGSLQPMVRYQGASVKSTPGTNPWNLDVGLSYLIKGPALRIVATYSHTDLGNLAGSAVSSVNAIQLGGQAIFF